MKLLPHQERVIVERDELRVRLDKLSAFVETQYFAGLSVAEQVRLTRQVKAMRVYHECLCERIDAFTH